MNPTTTKALPPPTAVKTLEVTPVNTWAMDCDPENDWIGEIDVRGSPVDSFTITVQILSIKKDND